MNESAVIPVLSEDGENFAMVAGAGDVIRRFLNTTGFGINTIKDCDVPAFIAMCEAWGEYRRCCNLLEGNPGVYKTTTGQWRTHPIAAARDRAWNRYYVLAGNFGFLPSARGETNAKQEQPEDDSMETVIEVGLEFLPEYIQHEYADLIESPVSITKGVIQDWIRRASFHFNKDGATKAMVKARGTRSSAIARAILLFGE